MSDPRLKRRDARWRRGRVALSILATFAGLLQAAADAPAQTAKEEPPAHGVAPRDASSDIKALRYASLKADRVQLRQGPGDGYPVAWVFQRAGLPVAVLREVELWREVRDAGGTV